MTDDHKLRRQNGIVAGVCGGLAEFTGLSVFWFRLLFIILMSLTALCSFIQQHPCFLHYVLTIRTSRETSVTDINIKQIACSASESSI